MAKGMHKPDSLAARQKAYDENGSYTSSKTKMHRPGSNKK